MTERASPRELFDRAARARAIAARCTLCPRRCRVDRTAGELGVCQIGLEPKVASITVHRGEEPSISGWNGAGNVFFSHCNLRCRFCQNWPISQLGHGRVMTTEELAEGMLRLEAKGVHDINMVTGTVQLPGLLEALAIARERGLDLPVVWNSNGYESMETLELLDGVVDVYLPDMKYGHDEQARRWSGVGDYVDVSRSAILEMHRQVGDLRLDERGIATRGLLIRHLVLPGGLAGTREVLEWIASTLGNQVWIGLMNQYFPTYRAMDDSGPMSRTITEQEWDQALAWLEEFGFENGYVQELDAPGGC